MPFQLLNIISILVIFICIVLAIFLFTTNSKRLLSNRLFGSFLLLTAFDVSSWIWLQQESSFNLIFALRYSFSALQMPLFLGFIISSCYSDFKLKKWHIVHALPFVFIFSLTLPGNQLPFSSGLELINQNNLTRNESVFSFFLFHLQYYIYIVYAVYVLFQFRSTFRQFFTDERSIVFSWLLQLVTTSIFVHTLAFIRGLVSFSDFDNLFFNLQLIGATLILLVMTWITLKALHYPDIFRGIDRTLHKVSKFINKTNNQNSNQDPNKKSLLNYMDKQRPYLNAELSLADLSEQIGMNQRELSELINQQFKLHFFDFINSFRIKSAKQKLLEDTSLTVLEILYSVGFNSKSSFNTAFKKHTQTTPTAYRKANL